MKKEDTSFIIMVVQSREQPIRRRVHLRCLALIPFPMEKGSVKEGLGNIIFLSASPYRLEKVRRGVGKASRESFDILSSCELILCAGIPLI
jgi:hypothetical protein